MKYAGTLCFCGGPAFATPGSLFGPCDMLCKSNPRKEFCALIFKILANYGSLLRAMGQTLLLALCGLLFGTLLGMILGILSVVKSKVCNVIAMIFVDMVRGVPMIVLAFFVFFGVPYCLNNMMGLTGATLTALQAGTICLALNCGAYMAEIIRAGIQSVDKGQMEAAWSLGLPLLAAMQRVVLPQAIEPWCPASSTSSSLPLKDTSHSVGHRLPGAGQYRQKRGGQHLSPFGSGALLRSCTDYHSDFVKAAKCLEGVGPWPSKAKNNVKICVSPEKSFGKLEVLRSRIIRTALRRPEAACCHCQCPVHEPGHHALMSPPRRWIPKWWGGARS